MHIRISPKVCLFHVHLPVYFTSFLPLLYRSANKWWVPYRVPSTILTHC